MAEKNSTPNHLDDSGVSLTSNSPSSSPKAIPKRRKKIGLRVAAKKIGLVFNVGVVDAQLRLLVGAQKVKKKRQKGRRGVTTLASVYLAAVLEYLVAEVIELAGNATKVDKTAKRINPRHVMLGMRADQELNELCHRTDVIFPSAGVPPTKISHK